MSLKDKLKAAKPRIKPVTIDGDTFSVVGLGRIQKNDIVSKSQKNGKIDNENLEALLLAACVCDPASGNPLMPDPAEWDVPSHIAGPLVKACIEVCGFDDDEASQLAKKLEETQS